MNTYNNIRLIGLTGKAESGKDTTADYLVDKKGWVKTAFAKPLKDICINYLGLTEEEVYTKEGKSKYNEFWGMTNREILQKVGTDAFRNGFHHDTWVKITELQVKKMLDEGKKVVISDCRFDNEAEMVERLGGIVIRINRNNYNNELNSSEQSHPSEQGVSDYLISDYIDNDGDISLLHTMIENKISLFENKNDNISKRLNFISMNENVDEQFMEKFFFYIKKYLNVDIDNVYQVEGGNIRIELFFHPDYNFILRTNQKDNKIKFMIYDKKNNLLKTFEFDIDDYEQWKQMDDFINVRKKL